MTDILQLPGWTVSSTTDDGKRLVIAAQYAKQPDSCQLCGLVGALYKHGPRSLTILDSPVRGRPSCIEARVQRYKCRDCNGTFLQPLEGIDTERRMTERCLDYIQQQSLRDTFQRVSEHLGCDEKTVRNVANDYTEALNGVAKVENRMGRGYSFEVIRARILFSDRAPSARTLRAQAAAAEPQAKKMTRCESCMGVFAYTELHRAGPRVLTLCANCHRRFHLEEGFSHTFFSTK